MAKMRLIDVLFELNRITKEYAMTLFVDCSECGPLAETYQLFTKDSEEMIILAAKTVDYLIQQGYIDEVNANARKKLNNYV